MAHGGKRAGAGRKQGSTTKRTREIADAAMRDGITPLEVMLKAMRRHVDMDDLDKAAGFAKEAAPYMHPRLAAIAHTGEDGGPIQVEVDAAFDDLIATVESAARTKARDAGGAGTVDQGGSASSDNA